MCHTCSLYLMIPTKVIRIYKQNLKNQGQIRLVGILQNNSRVKKKDFYEPLVALLVEVENIQIIC